MRAVLLFLSLLVTPTLFAQDKVGLRETLGDRDLQGEWVYDDLAAGFEQARAVKKPLLVVLRCVP